MSNELTLERVLKVVEESDDLCITVSELDNKPFLIFCQSEALNTFNARLNGFKGKVSYCYIPEGSSTANEIQKLKDQLKDSDSYSLRSRIKELTDLLLYEQFLSINEIDPVSLDDLLYSELEYGFDDEYTTCADCGHVVRTSPDSYHWVAPLFLESEGYICDSCAGSGNFDDDILEGYRNACKSLPDIINTETLGLVKVNDDSLENGYYEGMNDDPQKVIDLLNANDIDCWIVVYPSQFHCSFDVYVQESQLKSAKTLLQTGNIEGIDNVKHLKACLEQAALVTQKPGHIAYTTLNTKDCTVETVQLTPEEFVKGIKRT